MIRFRRAGGDRGSATIWVLACTALVLLVGVAVSLRTSAVLARHRAESAADLAALAAAVRIGYLTDVCGGAAPVAQANGASLVRCSPRVADDGRSGVVDVAVSVRIRLPGLGTRRSIATARAGRLAVPALDAADGNGTATGDDVRAVAGTPWSAQTLTRAPVTCARESRAVRLHCPESCPAASDLDASAARHACL